jgi:VanZ family protein
MKLLSRPNVRIALFIMWCLAWPGIAAALLMPLPGPVMNANLLAHFGVFGGMAAGVLCFARTTLQVLSLAFLTSAGSIALEFGQLLVPYRTFDLIDIAANLLGVTIGTTIALVALRLLPGLGPNGRDPVEAGQL